jgi:hypothetical protein
VRGIKLAKIASCHSSDFSCPGTNGNIFEVLGSIAYRRCGSESQFQLYAEGMNTVNKQLWKF